jgi:hypothetical protein
MQRKNEVIDQYGVHWWHEKFISMVLVIYSILWFVTGILVGFTIWGR